MSDTHTPTADTPAGAEDALADDEAGETPAQLREAAKSGKKALEENAKLARENAFLKAGVPSLDTMSEDDPQRSLVAMFTRAYEGELNANTIREAAADLGIEASGSSGDKIPSAEETAADQMSADFQSGGISPPPGTEPDVHPKDAALSQFHQNTNDGMPLDQAQREYAAQLIAASATDDRLFFNQPAHQEAAKVYEAS